MESESKGFKAVKVHLKASQKQEAQLSRSMLYSGINIFGQLSQIYLQNRDAGESYQNFQQKLKPEPSEGAGTMMSLSQDVLSIFKKLQKKDSTTKIKAFAELDRYLEGVEGGEAESDELQNLLTFFLYHFCRIMMNEPDKKVRESAHQTFSNFIKKSKRRLGPHIKKIFSVWYCSFFDVSSEVCLMARKNFELAFPENKRDQVFKLAYKNFLHFANEQLKQSEDQINEGSQDLSKAQREDVFDRVTCGVFLALANSFTFITTWTEEEQSHFKRKLIDILDLNVGINEKQDNQIEQAPKKSEKKSSSYLWSFLQSNYRGRVRASCLTFISNLLLNLPQEVITFHIGQLSPLIFNLIGEDNSSLQSTLWRDALFTIGKNYPQSWETISIKKTFLPKLYTALKNAGFGSATALYENFIKFASIFPFYYLQDYTEDKQNKASFKERCNLVREAFTTLYQGLKNDEAVAFHQDLVKCYYETFVFIVLKRVQPLVIKQEGVTKEDKEFAIEQMKKVVQVPVEDYIVNFEKFRSKVQNERNIRSTMPMQIAQCFDDMGQRQIDERIYSRLVDFLLESLVSFIDNPNTIRIVSPLLKHQSNPYFKSQITNSLFSNLIHALINQIAKETESLSKENIDKLTTKSQNLTRLLYKMNKAQMNADGTIDEKKIKEVLMMIDKKEQMAKNVLSNEVLNKFRVIKELLIQSLVLSLNIQQSDSVQQLMEQCLRNVEVNLKTRVTVLNPETKFPKIKFHAYYEQIKSQAHDYSMDYIINTLVKDHAQIAQNHGVIDNFIQKHLNNQATFMIEEDIKTISQEILRVLQTLQLDIMTDSYYFLAVKDLLLSENENYDAFRQMLFDKLLIMRSRNDGYNQLWTLFEQSLRRQMASQKFFVYCKDQLRSHLSKIIHQGTNYDVDKFNRLTTIVKAFVQLGQDKQSIIEDILLQEDNFRNLDNNSLPLKMFRDLFLQGGVAFNVTKLFSKDKVWLTTTLINSRYLPSLANFISLKKQLIIFVDTEVIPDLIFQAQNGNQDFIIEIFRFMSNQSKTRPEYVFTMEYFLEKLIDPGEDFPPEDKPVMRIDEFKMIFRLLNEEAILKVVNGQPLNDKLQNDQLIRSLRTLAYFIIDEPDVKKLFEQSSQVLLKEVENFKPLTTELSVNLQIYQCLLEYFKTPEQEQLSSKLLKLIITNEQSLQEDLSVLNSSLQFVSYMMNALGVSQFTKTIGTQIHFEDFILRTIDELTSSPSTEPLSFINLMSIIRKNIGGELITNKASLIQRVIEIIKTHAIDFDRKVQIIQENFTKDEDQKLDTPLVQIQNFEYEMFQDMAETMLVFPSFIDNTLVENDLYAIIGCGIESIQKAAFVILKFLYENFIPQIRYTFIEDDVLQYLKQEQKEDEIDQQEIEQMNEEEKKAHDHKKQKYKNKLAFKNIPESMIEFMENPPSLSHSEEESKQYLAGGSQLESIVFGDIQEGCMNPKVFGYFLTWNALLIKIENGRIKAQLSQNPEYSTVLAALNEYLEDNYEVYQMLLISLVAYLPDFKRGLQGAFNVQTFEPEYIDLTEQKQSVLFAIYTLVNFMKSFPSLARKYYQECERQLLDIVLPYIKQVVSPAILENEIKKIEVAQLSLGQNELTFALFKTTKEILANYKKGEIEMTLKIRIPPDYPLKLAEVEVSKQLKISEAQMRKWILAIRKTLQFQNGDIISAVLLWKNNIEKEIEGVEDCYICYCVVHETDQSLPKMPCKTCKNKFHVACIRKWFKTSHKSNCPICQNYFF